jgi:hypothetical protein
MILEQESYSLVYYNNIIKTNNTNISNILKNIIYLLNTTKYISKVKYRNKMIGINNQYLLNNEDSDEKEEESDSEYEHEVDIDQVGGEYLNDYSILKIVDSFINDPEMLEETKNTIQKLLRKLNNILFDNERFEKIIKKYKEFLLITIYPYYKYIKPNDDLEGGYYNKSMKYYNKLNYTMLQ